MMPRSLRTGVLLALFLLPMLTHAQGAIDPSNTSGCLQDLYTAFGREHRLSRAVIYGLPALEASPVSTVVYDAQGESWIKTGKNQWRTIDGTTARGDRQMQDNLEKDLLCTDNDELAASCVTLPRRGILETRKTPTSDLIQPLTQSIRALQCRLRAVCVVASSSPGTEAGDNITVELDGCMPMTYPVMEGCREVSPNLFETIPGSCESAREALIEREMQLLTLTASYDSSYRSLAQFAGIFQEFLAQFRFPLLEPLWQTVRMMGGFQDIPCFTASCSE